MGNVLCKTDKYVNTPTPQSLIPHYKRNRKINSIKHYNGKVQHINGKPKLVLTFVKDFADK